MQSAVGRAFRNALFALAAMAALWWWLADRPSPLSGGEAPARALRDYIEAAQRQECATVVAALSARSRELAQAKIPRGVGLERSFCDYSPATAKLSEFETGRIRVERFSGAAALVSASYTYDRFFGFFGRGRSRYTYSLVLEKGAWRVDLTESLDPESESNRNQRAMFLVQQVYSALRSQRSKGNLTDDPAAIRAEMPGFKFPEMRHGVADSAAPPDIPYVRLASSSICVSLRSASGTLVMVKLPQAGSQSTYQYGSIPSDCDDQPLARPYYGSTSGIK